MSETTFTDPKVIEASRNFVNVIAHRETGHGDHEVAVGKEKIRLCNEYFDIPCSVHVKSMSAVRRFFQGSLGTPSTVFADPSGKEIWKGSGAMSTGELLKKMNEALSKVSGEKIPLSQWQAAHRLLTESESWLAKGEPKKAVEAILRLGKMKGAAFKTMTEESTNKLEEAGRKALVAALALENVQERSKALSKVVDDYTPLPVSSDAKKAIEKK